MKQDQPFKTHSSNDPSELTVMAYNVRQFGRTGHFIDDQGQVLQATPLIQDDALRQRALLNRLEGRLFDYGPRAAELLPERPQIVGLTEMWCEEAYRSISEVYPHHAEGPFVGGIPSILDRLRQKSESIREHLIKQFPLLQPLRALVDSTLKNRERLAEFIPFFSSFLVKKQKKSVRGISKIRLNFLDSLWDKILPKQMLEKFFDELFQLLVPKKEKILGSGLTLLSVYPILASQFIPFSESLGLDTIATKGVLQSTLEISPQKNLNVFLTHFQEGSTEEAQKVRALQTEQLFSLLQQTSGPKLVMGDFNVVGEKEDLQTTEEYKSLAKRLGMTDTNLETGAVTSLETAYTSDNESDYSRQLGLNEQDQRLQRLDYIFHSEDLLAQYSYVDHEVFRYFAEKADYNRYRSYNEMSSHISDHFPVIGKFKMKA